MRAFQDQNFNLKIEGENGILNTTIQYNTIQYNTNILFPIKEPFRAEQLTNNLIQ
jgi:hypothetical protein